MKKVAFFCVAALMAMTMMACGSEAKETEAQETTTEAVTTEEATTEAMGGNYKDGVYTAETVGAQVAGSGQMVVTVTIEGGKITLVEIDAPKDKASLGANAIKKMPAMIYEAQSAEVDKVSGATMTSNAIKEALTMCLEQAAN